MRGMKAVIMPALDCVCTLDGGEPDMDAIRRRASDFIAAHPGCDIYITEGYMPQPPRRGRQPKRGGSDYTAQSWRRAPCRRDTDMDRYRRHAQQRPLLC